MKSVWMCAITLWFAMTFRAAAVPVALELVLAVDVSTSVNESEFKLQRDGIVAAFLDPTIQRAIRASGGIAVSVVQWAASGSFATSVDWRHITNKNNAAVFAQEVFSSPRQFLGFTDIGGAIKFSVEQILTNRFEGVRRLIDVSGDGTSDSQRTAQARDAAVLQGVSINGLAINSIEYDLGDLANIDLLDFYERWVIGGPGAFVIVADGFDDVDRAMRIKLLREIQGPIYSGAPTHDLIAHDLTVRDLIVRDLVAPDLLARR